MGTRGQAYTLEAFIAALLLVSSLTFALQVTAVTPLSESTSNQHIQNQLSAGAGGVLATTDEDGSLKRAILYWDESDSNQRFYDSGPDGYYTSEEEISRTPLGNALQDSFDTRGIAYNVLFSYQTCGGGYETKRFIYQGNPSDNAVTTTRVITLYGDNKLRDKNGFRSDGDGNVLTLDRTTEANAELNCFTSFLYNDDSDPKDNLNDVALGPLYNVVEVKVIVWRM
jgi:hypothetical protein